MTLDEAHQLLTLIARVGNQRAAAVELGCSQWSVSNRMAKARSLLGDEQVLSLLNAYAPQGDAAKQRVRLDNKKSPNCHICGTEKVLSAATGKLVCRPCANRNNQAYKDRVPEQIKASDAAYYAANREAIRPKQRVYYTANREAILAAHAARRAANPDYDRAYYRANAEHIKAGARAYRAANAGKLATYFRILDQTPERREQNRARLRAWKRLHPDRVNADTARRQLRLRQAYPTWASDELIAEAYALAKLRSAVTGIPWEVDHIVPLNSDQVCGLHWEGNLQVIPAIANLSKNNNWWPDMPGSSTKCVPFAERPSGYLIPPVGPLRALVRRPPANQDATQPDLAAA